MAMSFKDYILNPMGKKNSVMSSATREYNRKLYTRKFDNILLRERSKIEYHLFYDEKMNTYWAYVKIPSEVVKDFYYDVVVKMTTDENIKGTGNDLFDYYCQFFSNDPAFVYTYAYVFQKNNMFVKELSQKMIREALTKKPIERNAGEIIGYVKSLYFLYLFMQNKSLNRKKIFEAESEDYAKLGYYFKYIEDAKHKIEDRQREGAKVKKKVEVSEVVAKRASKIAKNTDLSNLQIRTTKKVGKIQNKFNDKKNSKLGVKNTKTTKKK